MEKIAKEDSQAVIINLKDTWENNTIKTLRQLAIFCNNQEEYESHVAEMTDFISSIPYYSLTREEAKEIISLIVNAKGGCQAEYGSIVARNADVLAREDYREILDLIVNAKDDKEYQKIDENITPHKRK